MDNFVDKKNSKKPPNDKKSLRVYITLYILSCYKTIDRLIVIVFNFNLMWKLYFFSEFLMTICIKINLIKFHRGGILPQRI